MIAIGVLAFTGPGRADEEIWTYERSEEAFSVSLDAPAGTTEVGVGEGRAINVLVQRFSWEVWHSDMGNTETRDYSGEAVSGASLAFTIEDAGSGSLSSSEGISDVDGRNTFSLTMGQGTTLVEAVAVASGGSVTSTATLTFTPAATGADPDPESGSDPEPEPEIWSYVRTESLLSASVTATTGSTSDLSPGDTRDVHLHVQYDSWEIWESDQGNVETRNVSSIPASLAEYSWSVQSGDGSIPAGSSGQADANGDTDVTFTMGSETSDLRVDVSYGGSAEGVTNVVLSFSPPGQVTEPGGGEDTWLYDHTEGYISASLCSDGDVCNVPTGTQRGVHIDVQYTSWEVWTNNLGETEIRSPAIGPAIGAPVFYALGGGDASFQEYTGPRNDSGQPVTDANGRATFTVMMGTQNSTVTAGASFAGGNAQAALDFTVAVPPPPTDPPPPGEPPPGSPPPTGTVTPPEINWTYDHSAGSVFVSASAGGASVSFSTWEVWVNTYGLYENRNPASGTAINAPVAFSVISGDAAITSSGSSTDGSGFASCAVAGGSMQSTVTVSASFAGMSGSASFTVAASDADGDGYSDAAEYNAGTDPNDRNWNPDHMPTWPEERSETITMNSSGTYEEEFDLLSLSWVPSRYISGGPPPPPDPNTPPPAGWQWDGDWNWVSDSISTYHVEIYSLLPPRRWVHVWIQTHWTRDCKIAAGT